MPHLRRTLKLKSYILICMSVFTIEDRRVKEGSLSICQSDLDVSKIRTLSLLLKWKIGALGKKKPKESKSLVELKAGCSEEETETQRGDKRAQETVHRQGTPAPRGVSFQAGSSCSLLGLPYVSLWSPLTAGRHTGASQQARGR